MSAGRLPTAARERRRSLAAVLTALVLATGCSAAPDATARPGRDVSLTATATAEAKRTAPPLVPEMPAPALPFRELHLPPNVSVTSHDGRLAAFAERVDADERLCVLDLATGTSRVVLPRAVNAGRGWDAFRPVVAGRWLVWEEVSGGEGVELRKAFWRLLAAPLGDGGRSLGKPRVVDEGWTAYKIRPQYGIVGTRLYWSETLAPSAEREDVSLSGRVMTLDLEGGEKPRAVLANHAGIAALSIEAGNVVVTEPAADGPGATARVRVLDAKNGREVCSTPLQDTAHVSHWPVYRDGWLFWARLTDGLPWPELFFRDPRGSVWKVGHASLDPIASGRWVLFESNRIAGTAYGGGSERHEIRGFDLERRRSFTLLTTDEAGGWWQPVPSGESSGTLVLANDLGPSAEAGPKPETVVRVYDLRE